MRSIKLYVGAAVLALLAACGGGSSGGGLIGGGGGGGGGGSATITGGVVKGPVLGSTVCAFAVTAGAKGAALPLTLGAGAAGSISGGCYVTPADGTYNFGLPTGTSGDLLIEATGGSFCSNESQIAAGTCTGGGTVISLGGAVMSSVVAVPAVGSSASVFTTPLTTAAVTGGGAGLSAASFNTRFNTLAGRVIGAGTPVTPATPPTAANQPYLATAATALRNGGTLSAVVTALNNGTTTFTSTGTTTGTTSGGGATTTGTVNAALVGSYNLKFYTGGGDGCGTVCSYTDGQDVAVVIFGDGRISLAGVEFSNPFVHNYGSGPHLPEISWYDAARNIEYALSDNQGGSFSEINVYQGRQPASRFLGQIRVATSGPTATLAAIAGTYIPKQQYAGANADWTSVTVDSTGRVSFSGGVTGGPSVSSVSYTQVFSNVGGQVLRIYSSMDLNGGGVDSYDQVAFFLDSSNHVKDVEYYASDLRLTGVTVRKTGEADPVTIGSPGSGTWAITPGKITGNAGGTDYPVNVTIFNSTSNSRIELRAIAGNLDWKIRLDDAVTAGVNYSCVHGARDGREVSLAISASTTLSSRKGGNCNIVVTSIALNSSNSNQVDAISGRFTAELYADGRTQAYVVSNGAFNWTRPAP